VAKRTKGGKRKIAQKKPTKQANEFVIVGSYKERQLKWIGDNGVYNYPVREGDEFNDDALRAVKELWLFANVKGERKAFAVKSYVGKMTKAAFIAKYPTYKKPTHDAYYVFEVTPLDYEPTVNTEIVIARTADFGRATGVKKAVKQFTADGEYSPLAAYLPKPLSKVPPKQLRVSEVYLQMELFPEVFREYSIEDVAAKEGLSIKVVRRYVASGQMRSVRRGSRYFIPHAALEEFKRTDEGQSVRDIRFVPGEGIDPETRDMRKRGKRIGNSVSARIRPKNRAGAVGRKDDVVNWQDIGAYWNRPGVSRQMTFVDLFCGAGGLSKGLEMAGMEGVCGLDWFDEAGQTYARNFDHPFINGDIKLPENKNRFYATVRDRLHGRQLSVVAGGFPCQGFSMAGNRIVDDPRNSLYKELVEIVQNLQPEFVICENVKGLRSMLNGAVEEKILSDFKDIGYEMNVTTLCAADYYTPQKRERVIFIGNRIGVPNLHPKPILKASQYRTTRDAIEDLMDHPIDPGFNHVPTRHRQDMADRMKALPEGKSLYAGYSDAWKKCPWNEASCTIKENHGGVNIHPRLPRVLTAREMARIQSFPDDFIFEGNKAKQLVQIGNAVPPFLAKAIGLAIRVAARDI